MNDHQYQFFRRLVETTGPSGYEAAAQGVWKERVADAAAEMWTDSLGNCFAVLNPAGRPRVMIDAHIDEIGFLIRYVDDDGYLYFGSIGGFDPSTLPGNRVRIIGKTGPVTGVIGRRPTHLMTADEEKKAPELKKMWIDIGAGSREEAEKLVSVGDAGGRDHGVQRLHGNLVTSACLDDRIGGYIMAETFRGLARDGVRAALTAVSATQEEIGSRGAQAAAYRADPQIGIALEVTWTSDHPESSKSELGDLRVGKGPAIFRGPNVNPRVFERLVAAAVAEGVPYQLDIYPSGSPTDGNPMQMSRAGMAVGILSVPTRYLHTASEVASLDDIDASVAILTRFIADLPEDVDLTP